MCSVRSGACLSVLQAAAWSRCSLGTAHESQAAKAFCWQLFLEMKKSPAPACFLGSAELMKTRFCYVILQQLLCFHEQTSMLACLMFAATETYFFEVVISPLNWLWLSNDVSLLVSLPFLT